jgi:hypothetical protein
MDLPETVRVNRRILALIASKYTDPAWTIVNTMETRYYIRLHEETLRAEQALEHGGIAPRTTEP